MYYLKNLIKFSLLISCLREVPIKENMNDSLSKKEEKINTDTSIVFCIKNGDIQKAALLIEEELKGEEKFKFISSLLKTKSEALNYKFNVLWLAIKFNL